MNQTPWEGMKDGQTFLIHLIFEERDNSATYLYGYACPYAVPETGVAWRCEKKSSSAILTVLGYADKRTLEHLLDGAEQGAKFGQFLDDCAIGLELRNVKTAKQPSLEAAVRDAKIGNGSCVRQPARVLPCAEVCNRMRVEVMRSPSGETMLCESLRGCDPREFYYTDGNPNPERMRFLRDVLRSHSIPCDKPCEFIKLGRFDLFSYLSGTYGAENGIKVERSEDAIKIRFFPGLLSGDCYVNVILSSDRNPLFDSMCAINCDETKEVCLACQPVPVEDVFYVEVKVWKNCPDTGEHRLIYHKVDTSYRIFPLLRVQEREFSVSDKWTKAIEKAGKQEKLSPKQYTTIRPPVGTDSLLDRNYAVEEDFRLFFRNDSDTGSGGFFPRGDEHQVKFLEWFQSVLEPETDRVILIDPYVKTASIGALLRCLQNYQAQVEIYLDGGRRSRGSGKKPPIRHEAGSFLKLRRARPGSVRRQTLYWYPERTRDILAHREALDFLPPKLSVYELNGKLHDRFIMVFAGSRLRVYSLTNSLDTVAENYASAAVPVEDEFAWKIYEYYKNLLQTESANKRMTRVYAGVSSKKRSDSAEVKCEMPACFDSQSVRDALKLFLEKGKVWLAPYFHGQCLGLLQALSERGGTFRKYLERADYLADYSFQFNRMEWDGRPLPELADMLWASDPGEFLSLLGEFGQDSKGDSSRTERAFLCAIMTRTLFRVCEANLDNEEVRARMLRSEIPLVRGLGLVYTFWNLRQTPDNAPAIRKELEKPLQFARQNLVGARKDEEFLCALVFLLTSLRKYPIAYGLDDGAIDVETLLVRIAETLRLVVDGNGTSREFLEPLWDANVSDLCEILTYAWGRVPADSAGNGRFQRDVCDTALSFVMSPLDKQAPLDRDTLKKCCDVIDVACEIQPDFPAQLREKLKSAENKRRFCLYQPFLKEADYDLWKSHMDALGFLAYLELYLPENLPEDERKRRDTFLRDYWKISGNFVAVLKRRSAIYALLQEKYSGRLAEFL